MAQESRIPAADELAALPRWARVALAVRCARRALTKVNPLWPEGSEFQQFSIDEALQLAVDAAAGRNPSPDVFYAIQATQLARNLAANPALQAAVQCAGQAAFAAVHAADAETYGTEHLSDVAAAITSAADAVAQDAEIMTALRQDFETLRATAQQQGWSDATPVPDEFLDVKEE